MKERAEHAAAILAMLSLHAQPGDEAHHIEQLANIVQDMYHHVEVLSLSTRQLLQTDCQLTIKDKES